MKKLRKIALILENIQDALTDGLDSIAESLGLLVARRHEPSPLCGVSVLFDVYSDDSKTVLERQWVGSCSANLASKGSGGTGCIRPSTGRCVVRDVFVSGDSDIWVEVFHDQYCFSEPGGMLLDGVLLSHTLRGTSVAMGSVLVFNFSRKRAV